MKRLRVLFAIHSPSDPRTAVYANVVRRAEALRSLGHGVTVVGPESLPLGRWKRLAPLLLPVSLLSLPLRSYDVIVFHSHMGWAFNLHRLMWRSRARPVAITSFHGLEPLYLAALTAELHREGRRLSRSFRFLHQTVVPVLLRWTCRRSDAVFCLNHAERNFIVAARWARGEHVHVVQNGVEAALLQAHEYPDEARTLLFLAQWLPGKGISHLAEAFSVLAADRPGLSLVCAGTGASQEVVRRAFPASVQQQVIVRPHFERDELAEILAAADIFVFPSLSEGASGALLEAMAGGLPIVATRVGAAPELLDHRRSAMLVPAADAGALAAATRQLLDDRELRRRIGTAAQAQAHTLRWSHVNRAFVDLLLSIHQQRTHSDGR